MNTLDSLLKRNKDFAASQAAAREPMTRALPNVKAIIIGCADMRVDPAHVLGIKPGEAVVMRNIGGRITPGLLEELALLGRIGPAAKAIPGGGGEFHLIVLQHTNCGMTYLAGETAMLAHYFQTPEGELEKKKVSDPRAAVAVDVALLRSIPQLPMSGRYRALSMTWPPGWLTLWCRRSGSGLPHSCKPVKSSDSCAALNLRSQLRRSGANANTPRVYCRHQERTFRCPSKKSLS